MVKIIEFNITNPVWRLFYPKTTFIIEQKKDTCIFTARTILRPSWLFTRLAKDQLEEMKTHTKEEGENLKQLLEKKE